jgi:hypothetical protein
MAVGYTGSFSRQDLFRIPWHHFIFYNMKNRIGQWANGTKLNNNSMVLFCVERVTKNQVQYSHRLHLELFVLRG